MPLQAHIILLTLCGLLAGCMVVALFLGNWSWEFWGLLLVAAFLVALGMLDDIFNLPTSLRFVAYAAVCLAAVMTLQLPVWLAAIATVYALWVLNLFNFMDGIDGIAASETVLVATAAGVLSLWWVGPTQYALFCLLLAAAAAGFLVWNWPPARLFMGDAGSVSTGFLLAILSLLGEVEGALPLACWLILLAVFVTDASVTLLWRIFTGQPFTRPHNLHLYQRLSRRWRGHQSVNFLVLTINVVWLMPLAALAIEVIEFRWFIVALAYVPLVITACLSLDRKKSSA